MMYDMTQELPYLFNEFGEMQAILKTEGSKKMFSKLNVLKKT